MKWGSSTLNRKVKASKKKIKNKKRHVRASHTHPPAASSYFYDGRILVSFGGYCACRKSYTALIGSLRRIGF